MEITHINVDHSFTSVRHKRRKFSTEANKAINEDVNWLIKVGQIREVNYPQWLAKPVVVKK